MVSQDALFKAASEVRANAYAPYSKFKVGAAIADATGVIHVGCNVENVAYPEGTCAEAGAVAAMCAKGGNTEITAVLVIADSPLPVTPCGGCRQKLAEFGHADVPVYLANTAGIQTSMSLGTLLPGAFSTKHMSTEGAET